MAIENSKKYNLKAFIIATLRRASYRWPARQEALKLARIERGLYKCNICSKTFKKQDIRIDHIDPVVAISGFTDWNDYINRMFCDESGLQVICSFDHDIKTKIEKEARKIHKKSLTSKENDNKLKVRK